MAKKLSAFGAEFAKQRKAGAKEFSFGGKKYNTKVKAEGASKKAAPKSSPLSGPKKGPLMGDRPGSLKVGASYKPNPKKNPVVDGAKKVRENLGNSAIDAMKPEKNRGGFIGAPKVKGGIGGVVGTIVGAVKDEASGKRYKKK